MRTHRAHSAKYLHSKDFCVYYIINKRIVQSYYGFYHQIATASCLATLVVDFIYRCSCSEAEKEQKNKYDKVAGAFLTKYLVFEEFDTNFNKRKIQVDGVTMSIEDFFKKISDDLGGTAKKEGT